MNLNHDFSKQLFRCHYLGELMSGPRSKEDKEAGKLGATAISRLKDIWAFEVFGVTRNIVSKYIEKGLAAEEDAITLYSRVKKRLYFKNKERLFGVYLSGLPDLFPSEKVKGAEELIDIKTSWDLLTFNEKDDEKLDTKYEWQLRGYMQLTGARKATVAYCLVDTPDMIIQDEKRKLLYKMNVVSEESPEYIEACNELEKNMKFNHIPMPFRVIEHTIEYDPEKVKLIYAQLDKCRKWLVEYHKLKSQKLIT